MKLLHLIDSTSNLPTTVKIIKMEGLDGEDIIIHQLEGEHLTLEAFDEKWDRDHDSFTNFISLNIIDTRKLVNAIIEEIEAINND